MAPGRSGGLHAEIPTMGPSVRSLAVLTQLRREQRWADVLILRGEVPAGAVGLLPERGVPPVVVHVGCGESGGHDGRIPTRLRRLARRGVRVVVPNGSTSRAAQVLGVAPDSVEVIPYGVEVMAGVASDRSARSRAARDALGIPGGTRVLLVHGHGPVEQEIAAEAERLGLVVVSERLAGVVGRDDDELVVLGGAGAVGGRADRIELVSAAADLVVVAGEPCCPSPWLLRAAATGIAVVASGAAAVAELVDESTGWPTLRDAAAASSDEIGRRGSAAAARVAERFALGDVAGRWAAVLAASVRSVPVPPVGADGP